MTTPHLLEKRLRIFSTRQLSVVQTIFFDVNRMFWFFGAETFSNFQRCFDITRDVECYFTPAYIYMCIYTGCFDVAMRFKGV